MLTAAILVDWRPAYLAARGSPSSLLLSPLGPTSVLVHTRQQIAAAKPDRVVVVTNFDCDERYRNAVRIADPNIAAIARAEVGEFLETLERSDTLLVADGRYAPILNGEIEEVLRNGSRCPVARHVVRLRHLAAGTHERVEYDQDHHVRAIRRLYEGVTQLETAGVVCALLPVAVAQELAHLDPLCPTELRARLAARGVPSLDVVAGASAFDLADEQDLLSINERLAGEALRTAPPAGFTERAPGVWVGPNCRIDPTSRICAPAILHERVAVGARAAVIGPAVLGRGARVDQDAVVFDCVLEPGARVMARSYVGNCVFASQSNGSPLKDHRAESTSTWRPRTFPLLSQREHHGGPNGRAEHAQTARAYAVAKRAFEFAVALAGLILLSPLLLVVAVVVKLTSSGPVLFGHEREGRGGKVFRCWKFRTMVEGAHAQQRALYRENTVDGPQFKLPDDPRVTWLGRLLRETNIDELPQLFNVLRGDMSLIGPRPSPFRENQICVPWREARLSVRPGITGLWQVCRNERAAGDFHQWIYYDTLYVQHRCFALDLRILLATFLTLGGRWGVPLSWMIPAKRRKSFVVPPAVSAASAEVAKPARRSGSDRMVGISR